MNEIKERKIINGKSCFPHRTLLTKEKQIEEIESYGFEMGDLYGEIDLRLGLLFPWNKLTSK